MLAAMRRSYAVQAAAPLRRLQQPRVAAAMRTVHTTAPLQTNPDTFPVRGALSLQRSRLCHPMLCLSRSALPHTPPPHRRERCSTFRRR